jgi:hypothetical protein
MSVITDVVIVCGDSEHDAAGYLNRWLKENDPRGQQLKEISLAEGGGQKFTSATVYAACFNFLPLTGFMKAFRDAPWSCPWSAVAYIDPEATDTFVMTPGRSEEWLTVDPPTPYY